MLAAGITSVRINVTLVLTLLPPVFSVIYISDSEHASFMQLK